MRWIWLFLDCWKYFLGFPNILEESRIKILEFGDHQTEFGGACMVWTQDLRKSMFFTWIMNKWVYKNFLDGIMPWSTFTGHTKPSLEIWFKTEHFEILSFQAPGSDFGLFTSWAWNDSRDKFPWILEIWKVDMDSTRRDEQNPEIILKSEKFGFSTNFAPKHNFCKNRGKVVLIQCF